MSPRDPTPTGDQRNLGTAIALGGLLAVGGGLFALVMVVLPIARGFCWVGLIVLLPALFHYFIWGRWMSRVREQELERERLNAGPSQNRGG